MKRALKFILILVLFFPKNIHSQSITPFTMNIGGGYTTSLEWSIGESASIANFIASGYSLSTGVLQPNNNNNNIVNTTNDYGPTVFGTQITIGPNPTSNILHIKSNFNEAGNLSFQLINSKLATLFTQEEGIIINNYDKDILLGSYPPGIFYVRIYFKPVNGNVKTGIYKIIKL